MADTASQRRRITPVILSGGTGTRLWPLSRLGRPKQLIALGGGDTLLQATLARVADPERFAPPVIVASEDHAEAIEAQLGGVAARLILEPEARNTAPAIALAALSAGEDDILLVMPSDHAVSDTAAFRAAVEAALPFAEDGWLMTFGIRPDRAETGYGYIRRGEALGEGVFQAAAFEEKPQRETAEAYLADGGYDWNAGIFLFRADACVAALEAHVPDIVAAVRRALEGATEESLRLRPDAAAFAAAPARSIDRAVMEKGGRIAVVPVAMGWSDIGSWEALHALGPQDASGNVMTGDVVAPDSRGCLIRSDGPVVVALGVEDLVIVATERAVLVVPRGESQRVKEAIDALEARRQKAPGNS
jgi:mannose-1-phosphate guanylyltransferase/mannose-1-phosphate guanylyltransferase/mannose-6-phosphate isomerase